MIAVALLAIASNASIASIENVVVDGIDFDVFTPSTPVKGDVLVLPGWDSTKTNWCEKQNGLCAEAEARGLRLVMPEMAKSVYADRIYAETTALYRKQITRTQLEDAIAHLQRDRGLMASASTTFCIGRSTGGRGCVLLALDRPEWFRAVASLSGDFDQTKMPDDALMTSAYGSFAKFPARWRKSENPMERATELVVPIYLGHGAKDAVVAPQQTKLFADAIHVEHVLHVDDNGAHNHDYWKRELAPVFEFFVKAPDPVTRVDEMFEKMRALAGTYVAHEKGIADSTATIETEAHGAGVVQHAGFVSVFARDGGSIVCHVVVDDGYGATLRARPRNDGVLEFRTVAFENATIGVPLHGMRMTIGNGGAFDETWRFGDDSGVDELVEVHFVKKPVK